MARAEFTWISFLLRLLFALLLVFASYNPHGYSYYDWAIRDYQNISVPQIFLGVVLLIGWIVFIRATLNSLGPIGITLALAFFGTLVWLIVDSGWVDIDNVTILTDLILIVISGLLTTGMSWSHIRRRLSGQFDVDETEAD